jgi:hypothetical protein
MQTTINYRGVDFDIEFDFQPYEEPVRYYSDGSGYPGAPSYIEYIHEIKHKGTCFFEFLEDDIDEVKDLILETLND